MEQARNIAVKAVRVHRSGQEIFTLMEEFEKSPEVSIKEFCEMNSITDATFYNWQKKYRHRQDSSKGNGFISLDQEATKILKHSEPGLFAEVNGIKIYRPVPASFLKELSHE